MFSALARTMFGSHSERVLKTYKKRIDQINALEPTMQAMSDAELTAQTALFKQRLEAGETLDDILQRCLHVLCVQQDDARIHPPHDLGVIGKLPDIEQDCPPPMPRPGIGEANGEKLSASRRQVGRNDQQGRQGLGAPARARFRDQAIPALVVHDTEAVQILDREALDLARRGLGDMPVPGNIGADLRQLVEIAFRPLGSARDRGPVTPMKIERAAVISDETAAHRPQIEQPVTAHLHAGDVRHPFRLRLAIRRAPLSVGV